ncbi:MAG: AI-2E family transporter [Holophagales bacterium]|nr:AI-2E family transporter [Holophagales bacterium]
MAANPSEPIRDFGAPIRLLVVAACVVVLVAGLRAASSIMIPLLVAVFIAAISLPVLTWLQQRLPMIVAVLGTILMDLLVIALAGYLVGSTANQVAGEMGEIQSTLTEWIEDGGEWLEDRGVPVANWWAGDDSLSQALFSRFEPGFLVDFVNRTLRATTAALSSFLVISLVVIFTLFEAATFGPKVRAAFGSAGAEARFARAMHDIQHYMGIKTVISLATGLLIGIWVGVLGVEFAVFWGLVAFVLNFIPNLGSIIAAVPTTLLAMVQIGVGRALLVALGYLVVNMVIGNFIEPPLLGRRLGLSTLVVVLSLVFWGWVWGPVGMLLSVPLTMVVKILLENTEEFRWVAVLLGDSREAERLAPASGADGND